jgi:hypothetical protein
MESKVLFYRVHKRQHGRPSRIWNDNIKMDLETGYRDVDWIQLTQERVQLWALVNTIMNLPVPKKVKNLLIR